MKRILLLLAALVFSAGLAQAQSRIAYWQAISPLTAPVFTGQWTVNGSLCAAGQLVQGGSPTTCTGSPSAAWFKGLGGDGGSQNPFSAFGSGTGFELKDAANSVAYGVFISGTSPNRIRLTTGGNTPLVLQENGGITKISFTGLGTSSKDAFLVENATAATVGVPVQISPRVRLSGTAWNTTATAASNYVHMWWETVPVSGASTVVGGMMRLGLSSDTDDSAGGVTSYPVTMGSFPTTPTYSALWFGATSPSSTNFNFLAPNAGNQVVLNAGSGTAEIRIANATHFNMNTAGVEINGSSNATPTIPLLVRNAANTASRFAIDDTGGITRTGNPLFDITTQTTSPTCTTNCGTSPAVTGSNVNGRVTMGSSGVPASGWVVTFNGTWASAPQCSVWMSKTGMAVGKMPIVVATNTTTFTVTTNGTAPATTDTYDYHCASN